MSTTIDNRVVSMRFDNEEFEKKATKSISTLDKLKDALKFSGASKDIDKVNQSFKEVDANPLLNAINGINNGFATMIAKATIVTRATNALIDSTTRFAKSMTVDQVSAGWDKYAEKTSAVQTIMAATAKDFSDTGTQMEYVNSQLEKLNWFTDETSYNFTDMVSSIGKFTSNGIKLDKSVTAMQGIATWAAVSGANANEASRAMYNLSQALAVGSVKLIDWKSIENANMATVEFKENTIETAVALGTLKKTGDGLYKTLKGNEVSVSNFNQALSDAWLTSDVLMQTLNRYGSFTDKLYEVSEVTDKTATQLLQDIEKYQNGTLNLADYAEECEMSIEDVTKMMEELSNETYALGKKSFKAAQEAKTFAEAIAATSDAVSTGWMKSFELIFGDYEEAKKLWTNLANILYEVFAASGDIRNELLGDWKSSGGRTTMLDGINNLLEAILRLVTPIKDAFREIFPEKTAQDLLDITNKFSDFTNKLLLNKKQMTELKSVARGVFSVLDLILTTVKSLASTIAHAINPSLGTLGNTLLDILACIGDYMYMISFIIKNNKKVGTSFEKVGTFIDNLITIIKKLIEQFRSSTIGRTTFSVFQTVLSKSVDLAGKLLTYISNVVSKIASLEHFSFSNIVDIFTSTATETFDWLKDFKIDISDSDGVLDKFKSGVENACQQVGISFEKLSGAVSKAFETIRYWVGEVPWAQLIAIGFGIAIIKTINKTVTQLTNLTNAVANLTKGFAGIAGSLQTLMTSISGTFNALTSAIKTPNYLKVAQAIAILAASLFALAHCDTDNLWNAVAGLAATAVVFTGMVKILSKLPAESAVAFASVMTIAKSVAALAASLWILSKAFKSIDEIGIDGIIGSIVILGGLIASLAVAANYMSNGMSRISNASGNIRYANTAAKNILAMSVSILIIVKAIESISDLHFEDMTSSLIGFATVVAAILLITTRLSKIKGTNGIQGASALLAACISIFAVIYAVKKLADVPWVLYGDGIAKAMVLVGLLVAFFAATNLIGKNAAKAGALIAGVGVAIYLIIGAIGVLGTLKEETLNKGIHAIGAITICFMGLMAASNLIGDNAHKMSVTLFAAAAAMAVVAVIAAIMGSFKTETLVKGLLSVAALGAIFAALMAATGIAKNLGKDITLLTTMLVAVSVAIAALTLIDDPEGIKSAGESIAMVVAALAVLTGITHFADMSKKIIAAVSVATACLVGVAALLYIMTNNIDDPSHATAVAESLMLFTAPFLTMMAAFAVIGGLLGKKQVNFGTMAKVGGIALTAIAVLLAGIGLVARLVDMEVFRKMPEVAELLGETLGSLVGGVREGGLETVGKGLASFTSAIDGVDLERVKQALLCIVESAGALAVVSLEGFISLLTGFIGTAVFPARMEFLGAGIAGFAAALGDANLDRVEQAIPCVKALVEIGNAVPKSGGILGLFTGEHDFAAFGVQLALFGVALTGYSHALSDCDFELIDKSLAPVRSLVEIGNSLPESGLFGLFFGQHDFAIFGAQLGYFGMALRSYSWRLKQTDLGLVEDSLPVVRSLVEIGNMIPNSGILTVFFGQHDFAIFGAQIALFGEGLKEYYDQIKRIKMDKLTESVKAAKALVDIANLVPNDTIFDWLIGKDSIDDFGDKLESFGKSMAKYFKAVDGIKESGISNGKEVASAVLSIAQSLPDVSQYNTSALVTFAKDLKTFAQNLSDFFIDMKLIASTSVLGPLVNSIYTSLYQIQDCVDDFEQAGKDCVEGLIIGLSDEPMILKLQQAGKKIGATVLNAFSDATGWESPWKTMIQAGKDCITGLMLGLSNNERKTDAAGYWLGDSFVNGFRDATGWHSPPKFVLNFIKDAAKALGDNGSAITKSIASGSFIGENFVGALYDKLREKGKSVTEAKNAIVDALSGDAYDGIESLAESLGLSFDASLSDGVSSGTDGITSELKNTINSAASGALGSYSSAGTTAADAFLTALEDKISDYDLDISTIGLETELWEATTGRYATDAEKNLRSIDDLSKKVELQNEVVQAANEQYDYTVKKFGQTSEDAKKAYQSLLQEQIDLANLMNDLNDARGTAQQNTTDSMVAYAQWIGESKDDLLKLGFTMEEISAAASKATGYNLQNTTSTMTDSVASAVTTAMTTVQTTYAATAESTLGQLTQNFSDYGTIYSTAIGTSMVESKGEVATGSTTAVNAGIDAIAGTYQEWYDTGVNLAEGFRLGIESKFDDVLSTCRSLGDSSVSIVQGSLSVMSPSRKFMWIGEMCGAGLAIGIENMTANVGNASEGVSAEALEAARSTISQIAQVIDTDSVLHPEIQPVLDLSQVKNGVRGVANSLSGTAFINTRASTAQAGYAASSVSSKFNPASEVVNVSGQNGSQSFNFVQNNYSPKSLSRTEIYRNTNNQFSAFKEAVSKA